MLMKWEREPIGVRGGGKGRGRGRSSALGPWRPAWGRGEWVLGLGGRAEVRVWGGHRGEVRGQEGEMGVWGGLSHQDRVPCVHKEE